MYVEWQVRVSSWNMSPRTIGSHDETFIGALVHMRRAFDRRRGHAPTGFVEMPTTLDQWRAFFKLWLFGPPPPKQAKLRKWLHPAPGR